MAQLQNAPVVYVLGVLRFPQLVEPGRLAAALQPHLRGEFPMYEELVAPHLQVDIGHDGVNFVKQEIRTWHFASIDRSWALMVNAGQIALHTNSYNDRTDFVGRFAKCVEAAVGIEDVGIELVESIALRYVDLIVPHPGEKLSSYFVDGYLPTDIPKAGLQVREGVFSAAYATDAGDLRVQLFRRPPTVLPLELNSEFTQRDNWAPQRPEGDFAVLDSDHGVVYPQPVGIESFDVRERMLGLHQPIRGVFDALTSKHAMEVWGAK